MQDLNRLLERYAPRPGNSSCGLDLSMVTSPYDQRYINDLLNTMKSLDPGNPNLNAGFNFLDGQYQLFLLHFRPDYNQRHFKMLAQVPHPVPNWIPLQEDSISIAGVPGFGTCLRVRFNPFPSAIAALPAPSPPPTLPPVPQLPPPTQAPPPPAQQPPAGQIVMHELVTVKPERRDSSPKRNETFEKRKPKKETKTRGRSRRRRAPTGFMAGMAQALVGPRSSSSSVSSSSD